MLIGTVAGPSRNDFVALPEGTSVANAEVTPPAEGSSVGAEEPRLPSKVESPSSEEGAPGSPTYIDMVCRSVAIASPDFGEGKTVARHAGGGVMRVSASARVTLEAVTGTSYVSVTVEYTVAYTEP
jgi:hypothetical protein